MDGIIQSKILIGKPKYGKDDGVRNENYISSEDKYNAMKFGHLQKVTPHDIRMALYKYQKFLLVSNNELIDKWLVFK